MNAKPLNSTPRRFVPHGITLIELLVAIVILVTVLAAVIPMLSPNNDERKVREAARQLNSMLSQAQAQAARDGRPYGVAFQEFGEPDAYTGMALEAYFIAEPASFTGFSSDSRVLLNKIDLQYGPNNNFGEQFPEHFGKNMCQLTFQNGGISEPLPPYTFKVGDIIAVDGNEFMIADDDRPGQVPNQVETDPATGEEFLQETDVVDCIFLNEQGQALAQNAPKRYRIRRLPRITSELPLQFPRGIGIDLQGSGSNAGGDFDSGGVQDFVAVMFGSNGSVADVYHNSARLSSVERVFLLLGVTENGNPQAEDYDFKSYPPADEDELQQRRRRVNWLHPDARWVTIQTRSGRITTSENNISFNPAVSPYIDNLQGDARQQAREQRNRQREEAREFARDMLGSGGN